ncbi:hypothetical protein [Roseovarius sp. D0-M9]|uniref:hypothetical protein n=1 Tax=Roseovarius sp. D0-M9 TaxID=3127117 RepID=UPI00300FA123
MLRDMGHETASRWLGRNFADIDARSTVDLREMFEGIGAQSQSLIQNYLSIINPLRDGV